MPWLPLCEQAGLCCLSGAGWRRTQVWELLCCCFQAMVEVDVGSLDSSLPRLNDASAERRGVTACSKRGFQTIETLTHLRRHMTRPGMWALGVSRYLVAAWGFVRCLMGYIPAQPARAFAVACARLVGLEVSFLQVPYPSASTCTNKHVTGFTAPKVIISVACWCVPVRRVGTGMGRKLG